MLATACSGITGEAGRQEKSCKEVKASGRDFAAVIQAVASPNVLVTHPSLPAHTISELIAVAKSRPGQISYASGGSGSASLFKSEMEKWARVIRQAGIRLE